MKNKKVKMAMAEAGMKQWELAQLLGIHEGTLSRKFRLELPAEEQDQIVELISKKKRTEE